MKINVGDYLRTEEGIKRVDNYYYKDAYDNGHCIYFEGNDFGLLYTNEEIKNMKSSPNIIDLIEVGDYVNGYRVEDVFGTFINVATGSNYFQSPTIYEDSIKSIVTYETFKSMEYKIGE